ncbi:hypothetical protein Q9R20_06360 [Microbacterium sp. PRF11]|uniref:hypothetical protein n=1 Tax=Microbacterium sp. PRF11 TaxID=2962593 RepID=UPI002881DDEB|nr:hypothetical protein [Microbacterium sp. PRF11]MDT0116610.1 hypothetical protein [Microbacterium sp. PRF11]
MTQLLQQLTQPILSRTGWVSLLIGLLIPFVVSGAAVGNYRDASCTTGGVYYGAAPMLAACEPVGPFLETLGWALTVITVVALSLSMLCAVVALHRAFARRASDPRGPAVALASVVMVSGITVMFVVALRPDANYGSGSWIAFSSVFGLSAYAVAGAAYIIAIAVSDNVKKARVRKN